MCQEDAKRILDFWEVMDRVDPLPDPWLQTATICEQIEQLSCVQLATMGGTAPEPERYPAFMPPRWLRPENLGKRPAQSREEQLKALESGNRHV